MPVAAFARMRVFGGQPAFWRMRLRVRYLLPLALLVLLVTDRHVPELDRHVVPSGGRRLTVRTLVVGFTSPSV
jgi:hypothetical protein